MIATFRAMDQLLRGEWTARERLASGRIDAPARSQAAGCVGLGALYGAFMGLYFALGGHGAVLKPIAAGMLKVPLLFLLTLAVTFPSLYVFAALSRSRLSAGATLRLLLAAIAVHLAVLASFAPIVGFFTVCTRSYPFILLLNVLFFAVSGAISLVFLKRALEAAFGVSSDPEAAESGGIRRAHPARAATGVFRVWLVIYGAVGAQMGYVLRPFVGNPELEFAWLRPRESHFFQVVLDALRSLAQ